LQPPVCHQGQPYPLQLLCLHPASYDLPGVATLGNLHSIISFIGIVYLDFNRVVDHSAIKGARRKVLCEFDRGISLVGFSSIHGMVPCAVDARQKISRWVQALAVYQFDRFALTPEFYRIHPRLDGVELLAHASRCCHHDRLASTCRCYSNGFAPLVVRFTCCCQCNTCCCGLRWLGNVGYLSQSYFLISPYLTCIPATYPSNFTSLTKTMGECLIAFDVPQQQTEGVTNGLLQCVTRLSSPEPVGFLIVLHLFAFLQNLVFVAVF
jgi:hypothetical protein